MRGEPVQIQGHAEAAKEYAASVRHVAELPEHHDCTMVLLEPGEKICTKDYPPEVAFHPARLARLDYGMPPPLVLIDA